MLRVVLGRARPDREWNGEISSVRIEDLPTDSPHVETSEHHHILRVAANTGVLSMPRTASEFQREDDLEGGSGSSTGHGSLDRNNDLKEL